MAPLDHLRRRERREMLQWDTSFAARTSNIKPRFSLPKKNPQNNICGGQRCHKAFHRVSLSLSPPPPLATDGENIIPIAEGLRQQKRRMEEMRAVDGRSPHSPSPDTGRQSLHGVWSAAISGRMKEEKSRIHDCRSSQPRPSVTKASLLERRGWKEQHRCSRTHPGGPAHITWLRWLRLRKERVWRLSPVKWCPALRSHSPQLQSCAYKIITLLYLVNITINLFICNDGSMAEVWHIKLSTLRRQ